VCVVTIGWNMQVLRSIYTAQHVLMGNALGSHGHTLKKTVKPMNEQGRLDQAWDLLEAARNRMRQGRADHKLWPQVSLEVQRDLTKCLELIQETPGPGASELEGVVEDHA